MRCLRLPGWLIVITILLLAITVPALAHAELKSAEPAPGAMLRRSPETIRLTFSEPLGAGSTFILYGEGFQTVAGIEPTITGAADDQLVASVPPLATGTYTVQWNVTGQDGHPSRGSYAFGIGAGSARPSAGWLVAVGVLIAAGVLVAAAVFWNARRRG